MNTYTIQEVHNLIGEREGINVVCQTLTEAKIKAKKSQYFQGTILKVYKNGELLSYRDKGRWHDTALGE